MKKFTMVSVFTMLALTILFGACRKVEEDLELFSDPGNSFLDVENDGYVVTLNAQAAPQGQNGIWRIYNGQNGKFEDPAKPDTKFYGEPGETYLLGWEVSVGDQYEAETINVSFKPLNPFILTSVQDTLHNNISLYLEAEEPKFGAQGRWEVMDGNGGRVEDADHAIAEFIGRENEEYTLKWVLSYGSKEESATISFQTDSLRAQAGPDNLDIKTSKEAEKYYNLEGFLPAGATGSWELLTGKPATVYASDNPNSIFEGVADSLYTLTWTVKIDDYQSTDTLNIRFRGKWGTWTDPRDGQSYRFVEVNGLEWMAENYNYNYNSEYGRSWYYGQSARALIESGYPLETEEDRKFYGRLYNWYAAMEAAPEGWRLPSQEEFDQLINHLGGETYANQKLIVGGETGTDFNHGGYMFYANENLASRDSFRDLEQLGVYWTSDRSEVYDEATVRLFEISGGAYTYLRAYYIGASVRYIREVQ